MPEPSNRIRALPFDVQHYIVELSLPEEELSWSRISLRIATTCRGLDQLLHFGRRHWENDAYEFIGLAIAIDHRRARKFIIQLWYDAFVVGALRRDTLARVDILRSQLPRQIDLETYLQRLQALYEEVVAYARAAGIDPLDAGVPDFHLEHL